MEEDTRDSYIKETEAGRVETLQHIRQVASDNIKWGIKSSWSLSQNSNHVIKLK